MIVVIFFFSENTVKDRKYWSADPRRGEGEFEKTFDWNLNNRKKGTKASNELAILSLSPKIGPAVRHDQLSKSTTKLPELSAKPFGPPSARKTPLGSCQLNKIRSQSQIITKVTTKPVLFSSISVFSRLFLLDMRYFKFFNSAWDKTTNLETTINRRGRPVKSDVCWVYIWSGNDEVSDCRHLAITVEIEVLWLFKSWIFKIIGRLS